MTDKPIHFKSLDEIIYSRPAFDPAWPELVGKPYEFDWETRRDYSPILANGCHCRPSSFGRHSTLYVDWCAFAE
jgi:hypothetical protein